MLVSKEVEREATRLIRRFERSMQAARAESLRRQRRSASPLPPLETNKPEWWAVDPGFDPYRSKFRSKTIGHSIWASMEAGKYRPRPAVKLDIPKEGGGTRQLSIFQVADSAVSKAIFESVLSKNTPRLSGRAYAYRKDLSAQDAVHYVRTEWTGKSRLYIAEYDFSAYFDSIDHDYLLERIADRSLFLSPVEKQVMQAFLKNASVDINQYSTAGEAEDRSVGIPQGTSVSLILANLAATKIDSRLERIGVGFVRYADDTLIWSESYEAICKAVSILQDESERMGVTLNREKSEGISLLVPRDWRKDGEIRTKRSVKFLGYELGLDHCEISDRGYRRIQARCNQLIYDNLLREPLSKNQNPTRLSLHDSDYASLLAQLRRYLYGDLSEAKVLRHQRGHVPLRQFSGVMSAYPLLDDGDQLRKLDGWLLWQIHSALRRRAVLLADQNLIDPAQLPVPHGLSAKELLDTPAIQARGSGNTVELRIPSVRRIANTMRIASSIHGAGTVGTGPLTDASNPTRSEPLSTHSRFKPNSDEPVPSN